MMYFPLSTNTVSLKKDVNIINQLLQQSKVVQPSITVLIVKETLSSRITVQMSKDIKDGKSTIMDLLKEHLR